MSEQSIETCVISMDTFRQLSKPRELSREEIIEIALCCGFMLHSGYSQAFDKITPVSNTETLTNFVRAILAASREPTPSTEISHERE